MTRIWVLFAFSLLAQVSNLRQEATRLYSERKFADAARVVEQMLVEQPGDREARLLLGLCWQQANDLDKAELVLAELATREREWAKARYALARLMYMRGRFDASITEARAAGLLGEPKARVENLIGRVNDERGRLDEALANFRVAIAADRTFAAPLAGEASVLYKLGRYAEAKSSAQAALRIDPKDEEARRVSEQIRRAPAEVARTVAPVISFTDAANNITFKLDHNPLPEKILASTMAGGLAVFDYDNDGKLDIFFTNGADVLTLVKDHPRHSNRLYKNHGEWTFEDMTKEARLEGEGFSMGAAAGDFDNDGWVDLFVAGAGRNALYRNNHGVFEKIEGAVADEKWSVAAAWIDYDKDGLLDLFVVNYLDWVPDIDQYCGDRKRDLRVYCHPREFKPVSNKLYRNLGGGKFADVSLRAGVAAHKGKGMSASVADYDGDGWPDIFVTNDTMANVLFRNQRDGTFVESALAAGAAYNDMGKPISAMGADFRDYDNDGTPDLVFTALTGETFPLLRNAGGIFQDATYPSRAGLHAARRSGWGVTFADLNNDGWKDLVTANAHVTDNIEQVTGDRYKEPNLVMTNQQGRFTRAIDLGPAAAHRGLAVADLDGDGLQDIVTTVLGARPELWRNTTEKAGNWIGVVVDRQGARVRVGTQWQETWSARGYASSVHGQAHFGVGEASTVDVEVRWPDGTVTALKDQKVNRVLRVGKPAGAR
ncbi:MAG: tetratricopeptide repeat protein [Acidobacteria bacterium]|nr:tetratricopeptide repeat protein [Acidobacteriota bacterium]